MDRRSFLKGMTAAPVAAVFPEMPAEALPTVHTTSMPSTTTFDLITPEKPMLSADLIVDEYVRSLELSQHVRDWFGDKE